MLKVRDLNLPRRPKDHDGWAAVMHGIAERLATVASDDRHVARVELDERLPVPDFCIDTLDPFIRMTVGVGDELP